MKKSKNILSDENAETNLGIASQSKKIRRRKNIKKKKQFSKRNKYLHLALKKAEKEDLKPDESEIKKPFHKNEISRNQQKSINVKKRKKSVTKKKLTDEQNEEFDEEQMEDLRNSVKRIIHEFSDEANKKKKQGYKKKNKIMHVENPENSVLKTEVEQMSQNVGSKVCISYGRKTDKNIANKMKILDPSISVKCLKNTKDSTFISKGNANHPENYGSLEQNILKKHQTTLYSSKDILQRSQTLKQRMLDHLKSSQFRYLNEKLYTTTGKEAKNMFGNDMSKFQDYHSGYQNQVAKWPVKPLEVIIKDILSRSSSLVIGDFGCGDASLAKSVPNKVHSFDLVALNEYVTACNMSRVPLKSEEIEVAVFCLSLMSTNLSEYIKEAHRVLKMRGTLLIAEVQSRFDCVDTFVQSIEKHGFQLILKNENYKMFILFEFQKSHPSPKNSKCELSLKPCLYKKR